MMHMAGVDRVGRPISVILVANYNPEELSSDLITRATTVLLDRNSRIATGSAGSGGRFCSILDMRGASRSNVDLSQVMAMF